MELLIFRHGEATPFGPGGSDAERPLTSRGRALFSDAARAWARIGPIPECIVSSPYLRARQTADLFEAALPDRPVREIDGRLLPNSDPQALLCDLPALAAQWDRLCLVSHMPFVGDLVPLILAEHGHVSLAPGQGMWINLPRPPSIGGAKLTASLTTQAASRLTP